MELRGSSIYYEFLERLQKTFPRFDVGYGNFEDKPLGFRKAEDQANRERHGLRDANRRGPDPETAASTEFMFGVHDYMGYTHGKCIGPVYEALATNTTRQFLKCHRREFRESAKFYQPYWNIDFGLMSDACTSRYPAGSDRTFPGVNVFDAKSIALPYSPSKAFDTYFPLGPFEGLSLGDVQGWHDHTAQNLRYRPYQTHSGPNNGAGALVEAVADPSNAFERDYSGSDDMPLPEDIVLSVVLSMATNPPRLEGLNAFVTDADKSKHSIPPVDFSEIVAKHNLMNILKPEHQTASAWGLQGDLRSVQKFETDINARLEDSWDSPDISDCPNWTPSDPLPPMPDYWGPLERSCPVEEVLKDHELNEHRLSAVPSFSPPKYRGIPARGLGMLSIENFKKMDAIYSYPLASGAQDLESNWIYLPDRFWCENVYLPTSPLRLALVLPRTWTRDELWSVYFGVCYTVRDEACPIESCSSEGMPGFTSLQRTQFGQNCTAALYRKFIVSMRLSKNAKDLAWASRPWEDRVIVMEPVKEVDDMTHDEAQQMLSDGLNRDKVVCLYHTMYSADCYSGAIHGGN
ncbi:MAG: hypothetical protein KVP17_001888 [Porospora cf. gigantea B]|uniref:uncharacterized protein n=1 Tax=Porospora cf. gigantea B TaxID=2853592 RepID=UPI0035718B69|nr:MAG: hypothetical protein KVP17_001888 [Porospora cf. gigantea B]